MATASERRAHRRFQVVCPIVLCDARGREVAASRTVDVSDGGALLAVRAAPRGEAQALGVGGQVMHVTLRVPRQTPNTLMFQDFTTQARLVRAQRLGGDMRFAIQFAAPLALELDA